MVPVHSKLFKSCLSGCRQYVTSASVTWKFYEVFNSQKGVVHCIAGVYQTTSRKSYFERYKILSLSRLYNFEVHVFIHSNIGQFLAKTQVHGFNTRQNKNLLIDFIKVTVVSIPFQLLDRECAISYHKK